MLRHHPRTTITAGSASAPAVDAHLLDALHGSAEAVVREDTGLDVSSSACDLFAFLPAQDWRAVEAEMRIGSLVSMGGSSFRVAELKACFLPDGALGLVAVTGQAVRAA